MTSENLNLFYNYNYYNNIDLTKVESIINNHSGISQIPTYQRDINHEFLQIFFNLYESIKNISESLNSKSESSDILFLLSKKSNTEDVTNTFEKVAQYLENRVLVQDFDTRMSALATKEELHLISSNKVSLESFETAMSNVINYNDYKDFMDAYSHQIESMKDEIRNYDLAQVRNSEIERLETLIGHKVAHSELDKLLELKANKTSVTTALQRKANKSDFESIKDECLLKSENDYKMNEIMTKLENLETNLSKLEPIISLKVDKDYLQESISYKLDISTYNEEVDKLLQILNERESSIIDIQTSTGSLSERFNAYEENLRSKIDNDKFNEYYHKLLKLTEGHMEEVRQLNESILRIQHEASTFTNVAEVEALLRDFKTDLHTRTAELKQYCLNLDFNKVEKEYLVRNFADIRKVQELISAKQELLLSSNLATIEHALEEFGKDFDLLNKKNEDVGITCAGLTERIVMIEEEIGNGNIGRENNGKSMNRNDEINNRNDDYENNTDDDQQFIDLESRVNFLQESLTEMEFKTYGNSKHIADLQSVVLKSAFCKAAFYCNTKMLNENGYLKWSGASLNNLANVFEWEEDSAFVKVVQGGLYRVTVALWGKRTFARSITLNLNGQSVGMKQVVEVAERKSEGSRQWNEGAPSYTLLGVVQVKDCSLMHVSVDMDSLEQEGVMFFEML